MPPRRLQPPALLSWALIAFFERMTHLASDRDFAVHYPLQRTHDCAASMTFPPTFERQREPAGVRAGRFAVANRSQFEYRPQQQTMAVGRGESMPGRGRILSSKPAPVWASRLAYLVPVDFPRPGRKAARRSSRPTRSTCRSSFSTRTSRWCKNCCPIGIQGRLAQGPPELSLSAPAATRDDAMAASSFASREQGGDEADLGMEP